MYTFRHFFLWKLTYERDAISTKPTDLNGYLRVAFADALPSQTHHHLSVLQVLLNDKLSLGLVVKTCIGQGFLLDVLQSRAVGLTFAAFHNLNFTAMINSLKFMMKKEGSATEFCELIFAKVRDIEPLGHLLELSDVIWDSKMPQLLAKQDLIILTAIAQNPVIERRPVLASINELGALGKDNTLQKLYWPKRNLKAAATFTD
jgi:hypothetical protein